MKKKLIVIVLFSILISGLSIFGVKYFIENTHFSNAPKHVTTKSWLNEVGKDHYIIFFKKDKLLKFSVKENKSGIILKVYFKNLDKIYKKDKKLFYNLVKNFKKISQLTTISLLSYGIELNNANCIINISDIKSPKKIRISIFNDIVLNFYN